jgi:tetratricopeptide (TPR) repeat protein
MQRAVFAAALLAAGGIACAQTAAGDAEFARAVELHRKADYPAAIAAYQEVLKQHPNHPLALSNLGAVHARMGNYAQAIPIYQQALAADPDNPGIRFNLGLAYSQSGQVRLAAVQFEHVLARDPANRNAVLLLADNWLRAGENRKAAELLEPRAAEFGDDRGFAYVLGTALVRDGQLDKGQRLIDRILRDGDSAEAHLLLGTAYILGRDSKAAVEQFERAIRLNPKLPSAHAFHGRALLMTGDIPAATEAFRKELAFNPNDYDSNLQLGVLLRQEQAYDDAIKHIQRALELRPSSPEARYQLGSAYVAAGQNEKGREVLDALVTELPAMAQAHVSLATAYYRLKRKEDGDRHRAIAEKLNAEKNKGLPAQNETAAAPVPAPPPKPTFEDLAARAEAARTAEHTSEAVRLYREALALRPSWDEGWWYLGTLEFAAGRWPEAEGAFRRLTNLKPQAGAGWALLGLSEFRQGKHKPAFDNLGRGVGSGLPGENKELLHAAWFHLAILLTKFGDPETGLRNLYTLSRGAPESAGLIEAMGVAALRLPHLPSEVPTGKRALVEAAGRAHMIAASRETAQAREHFDKLAADYPREPGVPYTVGVFLLHDDRDAAIEQFRKELALSPKHVQARLQLAFEYIRRKEYAAGLPFAEEAVKLEPDSFVAHNALGRILLELGNARRAVRELETAVKLQPASAESHFSLARAYARAGMKEKADQARAEFRRLDQMRR